MINNRLFESNVHDAPNGLSLRQRRLLVAVLSTLQKFAELLVLDSLGVVGAEFVHHLLQLVIVGLEVHGSTNDLHHFIFANVAAIVRVEQQKGLVQCHLLLLRELPRLHLSANQAGQRWNPLQRHHDILDAAST